MPVTFDEYLNQKQNKPTFEQYLTSKQGGKPTFDQFVATKDKSDTVTGPEGLMGMLSEPASSTMVPGARQEPTQILAKSEDPVATLEDLNIKIPRISQEGFPLVPGKDRLLINLLLGGAELAANMPQFGLQVASTAAKAPFEPKQAYEEIEGMVKGIVDPAAKLAAAMTVSGESPQADKFAQETYKESMEHPEGVLMPGLVALGAGKAGGKLVKKIRTGKARVPTDVVGPADAIDDMLGIKKPKPVDNTALINELSKNKRSMTATEGKTLGPEGIEQIKQNRLKAVTDVGTKTEKLPESVTEPMGKGLSARQRAKGETPLETERRVAKIARKTSIKNRLWLGEKVTKKELAEFPDLAKSKPAPKPKPAVSRATPKAKEAWEMTANEWLDATRFYRSGKYKNAEVPSGERVILTDKATPKTYKTNSRNFLINIVRKGHIEQAINKGKPVPPEVLADYPELAPKYLKAKTPVVETPKEAVAEIIEGKRESSINNAEFKRRMLPELDRAINSHPEIKEFSKAMQQLGAKQALKNTYLNSDKPKITIEIPGDGEFIIDNDLGKLWNIRNMYSKLKDVEKPPQYKISNAKNPSILKKAKEEGILEFVPAKKGRLASESGAVVNPAAEISKLTSEMIERAKTPPEIKAGVKQAKDAMIEHDRQIRDAEFISRKLKQTFKTVIPDESRWGLIADAVERKGAKYGRFYKQLDPLEQGAVEWLSKELDKLDKFVRDNDVLNPLPEKRTLRHLFHWWLDPKTGEPFSPKYGKFSKSLPQSKQRTIITREAGIKKGLTPASNNVGEIIGQTWESVMRAHQTRQMMRSLYETQAEKGASFKRSKRGPDQPIRMIEDWNKLKDQQMTEGYERWDNPIFDRPITHKGKDGRLITIKSPIGIRKELFPFAKAYVESPTYGTLSKLNFAAKSMKLGFSLFHVNSLAMQEIANWRLPYKNIPRGLKYIKELPPEMRVLYREGLDLFKGYEDVGYQNKFFTGTGKLAKAGNIATKPIEGMRHFIFDIVQPGMKASFAYDRYVEGLPKALKEGLTESQWAREVVNMADGHFSHEHWKRSLLETNQWMVKAYFDPKARKAWQNLLLSPTWQREHLLVAKNVAKSFMPDKLLKKLPLEPLSKTAKADYRKYAYGAITMIAAVDLYNLMATKKMDGEYKHIWQNPEGKGFAVRAPWNEPSYTVTDKNGKQRTIKGGSAYIRPLKSIYEVAEWTKDPLQKFIYKLSPAISAIGQQFWPGEYRHYEKGWEGYPSRGGDIMTDLFMPISGAQAKMVLEGKRKPEAAVFPFLGMPTSKVINKKKENKSYSPPERKVSLAESIEEFLGLGGKQ